MEGQGIDAFLGGDMKTLYVSDLDGTLLRGDVRTSPFTNRVINELTERGMLFSYATARSYLTASRATSGLTARIPLITYNGTLVRDNSSGELLLSYFFTRWEAEELLKALLENGISPIVYTYDGQEHFSYLRQEINEKTRAFLDSRKPDPRDRPVSQWEQLLEGEAFYFTCIDEEEKLRPLYERYREQFHCFLQTELYSGDCFFEIIPQGASKANAASQLKEKLKADRLVAFGDGENDLDLFGAADEAYAVSNAAEKLKHAATAVIGSNEEDAVARWILKRETGREE